MVGIGSEQASLMGGIRKRSQHHCLHLDTAAGGAVLPPCQGLKPMG